MTLTIYMMLVKVVIASGAFYLIHIGGRMFKYGISGKAQINAKYQKFELILNGTSPGLFFVFLGALLFGYLSYSTSAELKNGDIILSQNSAPADSTNWDLAYIKLEKKVDQEIGKTTQQLISQIDNLNLKNITKLDDKTKKLNKSIGELSQQISSTNSDLESIRSKQKKDFSQLLDIALLNTKKHFKKEAEEIAIAKKEMEISNLASQLEELKEEISDDSPLNRLIYASFYEENRIVLDALAKHEQASLLEKSELIDFMEVYNSFLIENGLDSGDSNEDVPMLLDSVDIVPWPLDSIRK